MPTQLINHTYGPWLSRKRRENGASTYSEDICETMIPELLSHLNSRFPEKNILISTAPRVDKVKKEDLRNTPDLIIQFLHSYPYQNPFAHIQRILTRFPDSKIILITAYQAYSFRLDRWIHDKGRSGSVIVHFQPMFILSRKIMEGLITPLNQFPPDEKRIIYFGNITRVKSKEFSRIRQEVKNAGWQMDVISESKYKGNSKKLSREEIFQIISRYRYGIGVGRCALEMYSLGLRLLISGQHWGGLCILPEDYDTQSRSNFNGRVITGTRDLNEALDMLPLSYLPQPYSESQAKTEALLTRVHHIFSKNKPK